MAEEVVWSYKGGADGSEEAKQHALLIPADTSECERIFSLMSNLKTAQRNRLGSNL